MDDEAGLVVLSIYVVELNATRHWWLLHDTRRGSDGDVIFLVQWVAERSETTLRPGVRLIWTGEVMQAD